MSRDEQQIAQMDAWIEKHRHNPRVVRWLIDHPVPEAWTGAAMEYAWLEMPDPDGWSARLFRWLGL